jgi:uncharacterized protein YeaO (DUF488 family)
MLYAITLHNIRDCLETAAPARASRVLADRLWPRGLRKEALAAAGIQWLRDASPGTALRKAFHSGAITPAQFSQRYRAQLRHAPDTLLPCMKLARQGELQLLTATHDPGTSYLSVLRQALLDALTEEDRLAGDHEPASPVCYAHLPHGKM